ncbi:PQQ-binding-like beta-propeller repeat protein [Saccharicrinis sp. FJH2]|uniref:outer membrane protein assembly factor BamB family protein n=1 Tax=Saccharicrinis sp. FJH65 TaxID=3344659 RepID=UPI0035F42433
MKIISLTFVACLLYFTAYAQIYQFRGPDRDGKFPENGLLQEWPETGPQLLLEYEGIGDGWSSVISNGKYIYASGKKDSMDYLTCMDFEGNKRWQVAYGKAWEASFPNTRSTPTLEDDRIYIVSGIGELVCLNAETGEINWKINVDKAYKADWHTWGVAESPLIVDDKVICSPAGAVATFVAFDKITGEEVWKSPGTDGQRSYVSPVLHQFNGKPYILGASASDLYIVDPEDGAIRTSYRYFDPVKWKWQPKGMIWANSPVVKENRIFICIGYNYPAKMLEVNDDVSVISEVYTDSVLDNHHHGLIEHDGYLYGSNWIHNNAGNWVCLNWDTGEVMYEEKWNSKGEMVFADGLLYVYVEKSGDVGLVKPDPSGFKVISSFKVEKGRGQHWSHPYIYDGKLFLRHGDALLVYNIKA